MKALSAVDVDEAHARILKWIRVTPVIRMQGPGARPVVLKLECLQRSGSFKLRGAFNNDLSFHPCWRVQANRFRKFYQMNWGRYNVKI